MTNAEIKTEIRDRLSIASGNEFWEDTYIQTIVNIAHRWACHYRRWPNVEQNDTTLSTTANLETYAYPSSFRSDSIRLLMVGSDRYKKLNFKDYKKFKEDYPDRDDKIFSDYIRTLFVNTKSFTGGDTLTLYGARKPASNLSSDSSVTYFTGGEEAADEAIIKYALAIALRKAQRIAEAREEENGAKEILDMVWTAISEEQQGYHTQDTPMFDRMDVVEGVLRDEEFNPNQF